MKNYIKKISKVFLSLLLIISSTGCFSKTVLTKESFTTVMESKGFELYDISSEYEAYGYIENVIIAKSDSEYQLEFYVFEDEDYATTSFEKNKQNFESLKGSLSSKAEVNAGNYSTYALTKDDAYMYLSRVDNTLLYIDIDKKYKDEVKSIVEELGY